MVGRVVNALLAPGTLARVRWIDQSAPRWVVRDDLLIVERPHPSGTKFRWQDGFCTVTIGASQIVDIEVVE